MSRTERRDKYDHPIRDGEWNRRCYERHCDYCGTGIFRRAHHRAERRRERNLIEEQRD